MSLSYPESKTFPARAYPRSSRTPSRFKRPTVSPEFTPYIGTRVAVGTCCPMYSNPPCASISGPVPENTGPCPTARGSARNAPQTTTQTTAIFVRRFIVSPLHSDFPASPKHTPAPAWCPSAGPWLVSPCLFSELPREVLALSLSPMLPSSAQGNADFHPGGWWRPSSTKH